MTLLHDASEAKKFDIRVVERNVQRGLINAEDAENASKVLPDDSENAEWADIEAIAADTSNK